MTHNFSDFNSITLTLGDIKLKLLTGKLAKSMPAPGGLLPVPRNPHRYICWVLSIHFEGQNLKQCHGPSSRGQPSPQPPPGGITWIFTVGTQRPRRFWKRQGGRMRPRPQSSKSSHRARAPLHQGTESAPRGVKCPFTSVPLHTPEQAEECLRRP